MVLSKLARRITDTSTFKEVEVAAIRLWEKREFDKLIDLCMHEWVVPIQLPLCARSIPLGVIVTKALGALQYQDLGGLRNVDYAGDDRVYYPLKEHIGAQTKVNLFYRDVAADVSEHFSGVMDFWLRNNSVTDGLTNDAATSWLCWLVAVDGIIDDEIKRAVLKNCQDLKALKRLNELLKSLGLSSTKAGACLCELAVLAGRMTGSVSAREDVQARINRRLFQETKSCGIGKEIRPFVRAILKSEMGEVEWQDKESYWANRWLYTKSGAHSQFFEERVFGKKLDLPERPTRREFAENVKECMVASGPPIVDAGLSWKLEHGKTRAIYSCDTGSYFTFDYLLRPIENSWANREVLLNPGGVREDVMYAELSKGECKLMIDYDDFNSQHTIEAMQCVIEEACAGAPKEVLKWAVESFRNMYVHWTDEDGSLRRDRMVGTLPSGHRATSFINTILNAAYIHLACGGPANLMARHTGDDIVMTGTPDECERVLRAVTKSQLRTNPAKQGIGRSGEFLRVSFSKEGGGYGYVARAIASLCSGNWVSEGTRSPAMIADNIVSGSYNVAVRCGNQRFGLVCISSMKRRCPGLDPWLTHLLCFNTALNGGVVWSKTPDSVVNIVYKGELKRAANDRVRKSFATQDFISRNVKMEEVEKYGVRLGTLARLMQDASYKVSAEVVGQPTVSVERTSLPVRVGTRYWSKAPRVEGMTVSALTVWAKTPEQRACLRMLEGKGVYGLSVGDRGPVCNAGSLPWAFLMSMRSSYTTPIAVHTHFQIRK